jgi:hypothetical protein
MTYPVRSSQATMKPVTKQAKASIPVMARSAGNKGTTIENRRFPDRLGR